MNDITVEKIESVGKGKIRVTFDTGLSCLLYRGEARSLNLSEECIITHNDYEHMLTDVIGKRAKKRAMHLLEQMDRTEKQLRDKLLANEYPQSCIDMAIEYVKSYHYIDDERYACNYVRFAQEKKSRQRIKQDLMRKGIGRDIIEYALEEEFETDETEQIKELLEKKHFQYQESDQKEFQRIYNFLLRRGLHSSDILNVMKQNTNFHN